MYQTPTSLDPLLAPESYYSAETYAAECRQMFHQSWHLVGISDSLQNPGDYISADVVGVPVVVRNFDGELIALRNVCAHRQCSLVSEPQGHRETLKCPYHGWEYGSDGLTRKIPGASNFPHFQRDQYRLDRFHVEQCGQLVFVRLADDGPSLKEWIGDLYDQFVEWFSAPQYKISLNKRFDYAANWKIPVEGTLESYHIPEVHPQTFSEDPGESRSNHSFRPTSSSFYAELVEPRRIDRLRSALERALLRFMGVEANGLYHHHHIYPNLLVSHTDSLTLAHYVQPTGPTSAVGCAWQFGRQPDRGGFPQRMIARGWGKFTGAMTVLILSEDISVFPKMQAGVRGASRSGILGRCEERLHSFQQYVCDRLLSASDVELDAEDLGTCTPAECRPSETHSA